MFPCRHPRASFSSLDVEGVQEVEHTRMSVKCSITIIIQLLFCYMLCQPCYGTLSDIQCLKRLKESVDPNNKLEWTFTNTTEGSICGFNGVECWHPNENKILSLHLGSMGLKGHFPDGLENCSSMTSLDLSSNSLSGPIPADISKQLPFITNLDLSYNSFSGEIPESLANCTYLNIVNLQNNKLTGAIPGQLGILSRLSQFNVANNQLSGPIPSSFGKFASSNFANQDLCGRPLSNDCTATSSSRTGVIIGSAVGGAVIMFIIVGVILFIFLRKMPAKKKEKDLEENKWAKNIKSAKGAKVYFSFWNCGVFLSVHIYLFEFTLLLFPIYETWLFSGGGSYCLFQSRFCSWDLRINRCLYLFRCSKIVGIG
jgi:hypothetical protein